MRAVVGQGPANMVVEGLRRTGVRSQRAAEALRPAQMRSDTRHWSDRRTVVS
jgi:hypothetical protein